MSYLLDSNIVTKFQSADRLPALCRVATRVPLHMVEEVFDELTLAQTNDSPQILAKKQTARRALEGSAIQIHEIFPDTPESELLSRLRTGRTSPRDLGEAASIAFAHPRPEFVFVCGDKNGVLSALNELHGTGERVLRPHVFLRRLYDVNVLTPVDIGACASRFRDFGILPSWWEEWLTEINAQG